jgi:ribosomal protein S18 acetylase RimI-like enzyme
MRMQVTRRPETPADEAFLRALITDTISGELGASAWPEPMRTHLLDMQYRGRRRHTHSGIASYVIEADGVPAGWLLLAELPHERRIVEIMVTAEQRGRGIASAAIREILQSAGKPVRLNVNVTNERAIRLYRSLGFAIEATEAVQHVMMAAGLAC